MVGTVEGFRAWAANNDFDLEGVLDATITRELLAATSQAVTETGRMLDPIENATSSVRGNGTRSLPIPDFLSITGVTVDGMPVDPSLYVVRPENAEPKRILEHVNGYWPKGSLVRIAGTLGYKTSIPEDLVNAVYWLASGQICYTESSIKSVSIQGVSVTAASDNTTQTVTDAFTRHRRDF